MRAFFFNATTSDTHWTGMEQSPVSKRVRSISVMLCAAALGACGGEPSVGLSRGSLTATCDDGSPGNWLCPDEKVVECNDGSGAVDVDVLYVPPGTTETLDCDAELTVSDAGPFAPGVHTIDVSNGAGDAICSAQLTVVDTEAPVVMGKTMFLWPPNHKLHDIAVSDCVDVVDACDGDLRGEFIWGSSDEPINDIGDGNHEPDILFGDCEHVQVRAERQGPKDGRVYKLGVRVVDGAGNATEGECTIIVDHDQRGVDGADSGESYRVTLDGSDGGLVCDGIPDEPTAPEGGMDGTGGSMEEPPMDTDDDSDEGVDEEVDPSTGGSMEEPTEPSTGGSMEEPTEPTPPATGGMADGPE